MSPSAKEKNSKGEGGGGANGGEVLIRKWAGQSWKGFRRRPERGLEEEEVEGLEMEKKKREERLP